MLLRMDIHKMKISKKIAQGILVFLPIVTMVSYAAITLKDCAAMTDSNKRLQCFDRLARTPPAAASQPATSSVDPAAQTIKSNLQEVWDKDIQSVTINSSNHLVIHANFKTINQITYEVMLSVVCGRLVKDQKTMQRLAAIAIMNQSQQQGYVFTAPLQCSSIAFRPLDQVRLVILANTQKFTSP